MFGCILRGHKYNCPWIRFENIVWIMGDWEKKEEKKKIENVALKYPTMFLRPTSTPGATSRTCTCWRRCTRWCRCKCLIYKDMLFCDGVVVVWTVWIPWGTLFCSYRGSRSPVRGSCYGTPLRRCSLWEVVGRVGVALAFGHSSCP